MTLLPKHPRRHAIALPKRSLQIVCMGKSREFRNRLDREIGIAEEPIHLAELDPA